MRNHRAQKEASSGSPPLTLVKPAPTGADKYSTPSQNPTQTDKSTSTLVLPPATSEQPTAPAAGAGPGHDLTSGGSAAPATGHSATGNPAQRPRPQGPRPRAAASQAAPHPAAPHPAAPHPAAPAPPLPSNPRTELPLLSSAAPSRVLSPPPTGTIGRSPQPPARPMQPPVYPASPLQPAPPLCPASACYHCPPSAALSRQNAAARSPTPPCAPSR